MAPHCAIVGPHMSTKYCLQLQHIDVFFHMGHYTPHCPSSRGIGIRGDSIPGETEHSQQRHPEHLGPVPPRD